MKLYLFSALLLLLGSGFIFLGFRGRSILPRGRVVYIDSRRLGRTPETLYDPATGLAGRPDYLLRHWSGTIPVELKSSQAPSQPYEGHILQSAAYGHLVEATTGRRPNYGILQYRDQAFRIRYSRRLRHTLLHTLESMRMTWDKAPNRSHDQASRCRGCAYRSHCDQPLS